MELLKIELICNFPSTHKIVVSDYWLLGLIEGEGSFYLDRIKRD
jgi:hypothetical protein